MKENNRKHETIQLDRLTIQRICRNYQIQRKRHVLEWVNNLTSDGISPVNSLSSRNNVTIK